MSGKAFQEGLKCYRGGNYTQALKYFNQVLENVDSPNITALDTRAATYLKLGHAKEGLKDARKTIELAPERWQGYARAAQIYFELKKADKTLTLVTEALLRLSDKEGDRRSSLLALEANALKAVAIAEQRRRRYSHHLGNLPIEIFGEIVKLVVWADPTAVIPLSHVSKHWRSVIQNSSCLWDVLILTNRRPKLKAKQWIERSKGKIYELAIRPSVANTADWLDTSLKGIRWDEIRRLTYESWDLPQHLLCTRGTPTILPRLEHLDVTNADWGFIIQQDTSLFHLALRCCHISSQSISHIKSNCAKIKELILEKVKFGDDGSLLQLLQSLPVVEKLVLHHTNTSIREDLRLPHLMCLDVKGPHISSLSLSDLPKLTTLRLQGVHVAQQLLNVVSRCQSQITELVLQSCALSSASVVQALKNCPQLQTLELSNSTAAEVLEYLSEPDVSTNPPSSVAEKALIPCPNLQSVNFSRCADVRTGPIVRMIKARLPRPELKSDDEAVEDSPSTLAVKRLRNLVIDGCIEIDSTWLRWIREHVPSVSCVYMDKKAKFRA